MKFRLRSCFPLRLLWIVLVCVFFLMSGCSVFGEEESGIRLSVNQSTYAIGSTVSIKVKNHSNSRVHYPGNCFTLEHRRDSKWGESGIYGSCEKANSFLEPQMSKSFQIRVDSSLVPGTYRFRLGRPTTEEVESGRPVTNPLRIER